jgi:hypothetical protein
LCFNHQPIRMQFDLIKTSVQAHQPVFSASKDSNNSLSLKQGIVI